MSRIRTIKPAFFTDEDMAELSTAERLTFIGLWTYVDDDGRAVDNPALIKAALWPLEAKVTVKKVDEFLSHLSEIGRITRYSVGGKRFLSVTNFLKHQRISKPSKSEIPPEPTEDDSRNGRGTVAEGVSEERKGREEEVEGKGFAPAPAGKRGFEVWDALVELLGYEPQAKDERSLWGKRVRELKEAGATAEEVRKRGQVWKRTYPTAKLTVNVLPRWWGALGAEPINGSAPAAWANIAAAAKAKR